MHDEGLVVIGGVDAHADTHEAAALDQRGALLGTKRFPTTFTGYGDLLDWLRAIGAIELVAIESTGSYAAGLTRYLREHGVAVVEVNQPHAHTRRRRGKSDPIDAEMAARLALAGKATTVPKQTDGIVESIRLLRVALQRGEGSQRHDGPALRADRHRTPGVARAAVSAQDDPRQGSALSAAAAEPNRARSPDPGSQAGIAVARAPH